MSLEPHTVAIVLAIVFLAALSRSAFGFGDALIAMPLLSMLVDVKLLAAPLVALLSVTIAAAIVVSDWRSIHIKTAGWLVLSSLPGILIGFKFLTAAPERSVHVVLAVLIIGFSCCSLLKPYRFELRSDRTAYIFGFVAGILGGAYNMQGTPLAVYGALRKWSAQQFRATLQGFFLATSVLIVLLHGVRGLFVPPLIRMYVFSLSVVVLAILLGTSLNRRIQKGFPSFVYVLLIIIGAASLLASLRR